MEVTTVNLDNPCLLFNQSLNDCWLASARSLLVQTATPSIYPSFFGKGQGVIVSARNLPNSLFQRNSQEFVHIASAQIWKAKLAV